MRCGGGFAEVVGMSIRSRLDKARRNQTQQKKEQVRKKEYEKKEKGVAPLIGAASE